MMSTRKHRGQLSVWGYIRNNYSEEFPVELLQLCFAMYFINIDSWDRKLSNLLFAFHENKVELDNNARGWPNCFGKSVFSRYDFMEWKFKISYGPHLKRYHRAIYIGIIEADRAINFRQNTAKFCRSKNGMAFYVVDGKIYGDAVVYDSNHGEYAKSKISLIKEHDLVIMTLDLNPPKGTLSFKTGKCNDEGDEEMMDHGIAFDSIDVDKKYRMAISMWTSLDFVEILSD